jgi:nitroreductase
MAEIGLFEAIYSARALRRFKPDPVPDEVITRVLDAAVRAPSGSNAQNWIFIAIKDAGQRAKISEIYKKAGQILMGLYANQPRPAHMDEKQYNKVLASATYLFEHMHEVPVLLLLALRSDRQAGAGSAQQPEINDLMRKMIRMSGSSIYPAVQNVILACRGLGLGTVLTTIHIFYEDEVKAILGLPDEIDTYALMPIGYPRDKFGPVRRRPLNEVAFLDRFGNPWRG